LAQVLLFVYVFNKFNAINIQKHVEASWCLHEAGEYFVFGKKLTLIIGKLTFTNMLQWPVFFVVFFKIICMSMK